MRERKIQSQGNAGDSNFQDEISNGHIPEDDEDNEYTEISNTNKTSSHHPASQKKASMAYSTQLVDDDKSQAQIQSTTDYKSQMNAGLKLDKKLAAEVNSQSAKNTEYADGVNQLNGDLSEYEKKTQEGRAADFLTGIKGTPQSSDTLTHITTVGNFAQRNINQYSSSVVVD